jgi:LPXTG-site transpeptidase (sortase) family protein
VVVSSTEVAGIKSFSPSTIEVNGNARLRIDIFAPSDTALTGFSLTDNLPADVTVSNSTPPAVTGCGAAAVLDAATGAATISLTNGEIPAGQRCRIEVYVTSDTIGLYTNTISPSNITNNENRVPTADLTSSLTVRGTGIEAIAVVKGFNPLTVFGGSASTMSVELLSTSSNTLTEIAFTDNMPDGMILANPLNFNVGDCGGTLSGTPGANSFSFSGGSLPPFGSCTLTLSATMTVNGNLTNTIPASAVTTANGVTNIDPAEASLTNLPGVSLSKFFASNPITPGADSALNITIQNTGNIALDGLGFSDSLPAGLTISGGSAPAPLNDCGGTLTAVSGTQLIQLTNGALDATASCVIVVYITGNAAGEFVNTIPPGSLTTDSGTNVTNSAPATDTLVIQGETEEGGGGGGGRSRGNDNSAAIIPVTGAFLIPVTGFAPGVITKLDRPARPLYDATSLTLEIPVIKVKAPIVGVEQKNGGWDISWMQNQVGWLHGSAYPTWKGNSLLTAHVVSADGKPGVFFHLKYLGVGEHVFVNNSGYRYTYEVIANELVQPDDSSVMKHEEKSVLTLITCDSYDESTGTYLQRVAVRAILIDVSPVS